MSGGGPGTSKEKASSNKLFLDVTLKVRGLDANTPEGDAAARAELAKGLNAFPDRAVRAEFGAGWGAVLPLVPGPGFGPDYRHCLLVALHKDDAADSYVFYLFDEQKDFTQVVFGDPKKPAFHSPRFR